MGAVLPAALLLLFLISVTLVDSQTPAPAPAAGAAGVCRHYFDCPRGQICKRGHCRRSHCFPGDATVLMPNGKTEVMKKLVVGDKVAVSKDERGVIYSDVYAFGHKDLNAFTDFLKIQTESVEGQLINTLELTSGHFVPTFSAGSGKQKVYKPAGELKVGDRMWVTATNASMGFISTVTEISSVEKEGLYNPLTMSGTILVNGVMASVHSEWFLDNALDAMGMTHWLPFAYQLVLSPVRCLYNVLGKQIYTTVYELLDEFVNVAEFGSQHGGMVALTVAVASLSTAAIVVSNPLARKIRATKGIEA